MKTQHLTMTLLIIGLLLSLFLGGSDLTAKAGISTCSSACEAVHNSSFGKIGGVPIGFFAALLFGALIWCQWRGKRLVVFVGICIMAGAETYLTVVQFTHLEAICLWCLGFYGLVLCCLASQISMQNLKTAGATIAMAFLGTHFVFFPPGADIKASLVQKGGGPQIEIFASPSCEHCEEAITNLEVLCSGTNANLVLRPVGLSDIDRKTSTDWVCNTIFEKHNATSRRLSERIVWKNEQEARGLNDGSLAVPIIVVKTGKGERLTYKGWSPDVKSAIEKSLGLIQHFAPVMGLAAKGLGSGFSSSLNGDSVCSNNLGSVCGE